MNKIIKKIVEENKENRFFVEVFDSEIYKPAHDRINKKVVIDLGALRGEFSMYMYEDADVIYAIEPQKQAYKDLVKNCKELEKIKTFNLIISWENGEKYIQGDADGGAHVTDEGYDGVDNKSKIKSQTLATFMEENKIDHVDVLKVDVESHEPYIFKAEDFKSVAPKIDFIMGEHMGELKGLLEEYGFKSDFGSKYGPIFRK